MPINFRKRFTLMPGVRLNLGKTGISTTLGPKGASVNVGKQGVHANASLHGTGLSIRKRLDQPKKTAAAPEPAQSRGAVRHPWLRLFAFSYAVLLALVWLGPGEPQQTFGWLALTVAIFLAALLLAVRLTLALLRRLAQVLGGR